VQTLSFVHDLPVRWCYPNERGQARLPNHEVIRVESWFFA
jgi:hypothetical protein